MTRRSIWHSDAMPIGEAMNVKPIAADIYAPFRRSAAKSPAGQWITRPCDRLYMLSFGHSFEPMAVMPSLWCAVLQGRNQLFETMKRGGADRLRSVVMPQGSDVAHHPVTDPGPGR